MKCRSIQSEKTERLHRKLERLRKRKATHEAIQAEMIAQGETNRPSLYV